jgi:hypothetical protein
MKAILFYLTLVLALLLPAAARAQQPQEEVIVTQSASGAELRGRLVELSRTSLGILVNGSRVDVPIDNVLRIEARTDSVKNGAVIGASVLGGLSLLACAGHRDAAFCLWSGAVNTAFGALAGAGIDALHKGRTTIYSKPAAVAFRVAPAGKGARAQLAIRW